MKKHLLYIGNKLSQHGNTATSIETLGLLLQKEGYGVTYASSEKNKGLRLLDMVLTTIQCRKKADYVLIDVYSTANFWYAFVISQLCRVLKLKYVPKLHGGNLPRRFVTHPRLCSMIFNHAHITIAPSHYLLNAFRTHFFSANLHVPNAIEIKKYPLNPTKVIAPRLLWVRSFAAIYNPAMAVLVFDAVKKLYPDATLCMVGPDKDGCLARTQKLARELDLEVVFTGKLTKPEWTTLAQQYAIFINTTHFDNMPVSVIEAMALGLGVVSTNVGGIPFLLEHDKDALLVADNAVDEMVAAIQRLVEDADFFQLLTTHARQKAVTFDWETVRQQWFEILG